MEKLDQNLFSDHNTNYKIITDVLGKANNRKRVLYKSVKFKTH